MNHQSSGFLTTLSSLIALPQESVIDVTLSIPSCIHNSLIGPKGKLVRSVMDDCGGVRIQFPPSGSKKDDIILHGPKEDVKKAEAMLLELAEEQVSVGGASMSLSSSLSLLFLPSLSLPSSFSPLSLSLLFLHGVLCAWATT